MSATAFRLTGWSLLLAGVGAGIVLPHPATTALWTASAASRKPSEASAPGIRRGKALSPPP